MHKELSDVRDDNEEIIEKYNKLARATGNEELAFNYISDEFQEEIIKLLNENKESEAVYLVRKNTKMGLEDCKEYIGSLK